MPKYFVYTKSNDGHAVPSIWHDTMTDGNGKAQPTLFCVQLVGSEVNLKKKLYPFTATAGETDAVNGISRNN